MKSEFDGSTLTIRPSGRIDSQNAPESENEIFDLINGYSPENIVIDATELEYISSAGLRVVLKLKKSNTNSRVINASPEVYDIFSMTGFTDIIDVKKALREISVDGCDMIGKGGHGTVYRLDDETIVKLYNKEEPFDEVEREIEYAKTAFVSGLPTAIAYDVVTCKGSYGAVFELINADTLSHRLMTEPENFDMYSKKYIELIHKLHTTEAEKNKFSDIGALYNKWADDMRVYLTDDEINLLHEIINSIPDRRTLVHGDIHPNNIMVQNGELVLIDMADITYGHPVFDYAGMALSHIFATPESIERLIGINSETARTLWGNLIKSEFADKTDEERAAIEKVIMGCAMLKMSIIAAVNKSQPEELMKHLIEHVRKSFFPQARQLVGAVRF